ACGANVHSLIPLYVFGVLTAVALAQAGMVRYWRRTRGPRWRQRAVMNGAGAAVTGVVDAVVIWTKFSAGAWMVTIAIPILIASLYAVHRHYRSVARRLRAQAKAVLEYVWGFPHGEGDFVTVVVPELFQRRSVLAALLHRSTLSLKLGLLREPGVVVTDVPRLAATNGSWTEPTRATCIVPVADVH